MKSSTRPRADVDAYGKEPFLKLFMKSMYKRLLVVVLAMVMEYLMLLSNITIR